MWRPMWANEANPGTQMASTQWVSMASNQRGSESNSTKNCEARAGRSSRSSSASAVTEVLTYRCIYSSAAAVTEVLTDGCVSPSLNASFVTPIVSRVSSSNRVHKAEQSAVSIGTARLMWAAPPTCFFLASPAASLRGRLCCPTSGMSC
jgi:hypothetical protein